VPAAKKRKHAFNKRALTSQQRGQKLLEVLLNPQKDFIDCKKAISLLYSGADVTMRDKDGWTALMLTCLCTDNLKLLRKLIDRKADVNALSHGPVNIETPLIIAVEMNKLAFIKPLIDAGANVNYVRSSDGMTALMCAANGNAGIARILLESDARLDLKSKSGCTAKEIAHNFQRYDIEELIDEEQARRQKILAAVLETCGQVKEETFRPNVTLMPSRKVRISL
jgi:ankyrin repeat protein